jgi:hypothetical protein
VEDSVNQFKKSLIKEMEDEEEGTDHVPINLGTSNEELK